MIAANNNTLVFFGLFLVGLLFVPLSIPFMVPEADADNLTATVQNAPGSSYVGCEETNSCFLPSTVIIDVGGTVTWENPDNVPHTVTSGTSSNGPDGYFDSNLIMVGQSYSNTFDSAGTYTYFCMIHPWMAGTVAVTAGGSGTASLSGTILGSDGTPLDVDEHKSLYITVASNDIYTQQDVGADGSYSFNLASGTYDLRVEYSFYQNDPQISGDFSYGIEDFAVTGATTKNISLPTITLSGTVTDPSGQPVSAARIEFHSEWSAEYRTSANVKTDANGAYSVKMLAIEK